VRLETERLILRKPEAGDRDGYAEIWGDPEVVRFLGGRTLSPEEIPEGIERMLKQWERHGVGLFSVLRKEDERLIGRVGYLLWDSERWVNAMHEELDGDLELEIGWVVASAYWNKGYATEAAAACRDNAFSRLGRDRVISLIDPQNLPSIRVAEKIGERYERDVEIIVGPVGLYALEKPPAR
jgi:[ribosomal protein S5]-alanine N-acetyltransferase